MNGGFAVIVDNLTATKDVFEFKIVGTSVVAF